MLRVAILLYSGARVFDLAIATEAFRARRVSAPTLGLELHACATKRGAVELSDGVGKTATRTLSWLRHADLVLVPGLEDPSHIPGTAELDALRSAYRHGSTIASLCTGAFVLAKAGLLDGRQATTHWALAPRLAAEHPDVHVNDSVLYVEDGKIWTSAGVAAGIDMCLALLRQQFGAEVATGVARSLVAAPHRRGGQRQFIKHPVPDDVAPPGLVSTVQALFDDDPARAWTVDELAHCTHVSPRTFARRFAAESGTTPHQWLMAARLDTARRLLERTCLPIEQVATRSGFGSAATMRLRFAADVGLSPTQYREDFSQQGGPE